MISIVAIDIETTGLSSESDSIIEIGALRFKGHRVEGEWSTLINPNRQIPPLITQLTGINNEMVVKAPLIEDVLNDLAQFVGDSPVLGHNVNFDLSFLRRHGILKFNDPIDTFEIAAVLLPKASRYGLGALAQQLGILFQESHRALEDARTTSKLYNWLYEKCGGLPEEWVEEIVRLSEPLDWGAFLFFQDIDLANKREQNKNSKIVHREPTVPSAPTYTLTQQPLKPNDQLVPLDPDEVVALMDYGGPFANYFQNYEHRPQQAEMLHAVTRSISDGMHLMVEAGTGTGKSFAYLVPSVLWALKNQHRVVISTNTINLQDQLIQKDIPDLKKALQIDFNVALLKGRGNYICPRRLESVRHRGPETNEEMRVLGKVIVWLLEGGNGDRSEINLTGPIEQDIWKRLSAEDEGCNTESCMSKTGGACPFFQAHQAAQSAHIIIVNHALLLADFATGSRVLPDYQYLVVDEAHHLESATTNALSYRFTQGDFNRLLREFGGTSSGTLGHLLSLLKDVLRPAEFAEVFQKVNRLTDLAIRLDHDCKVFFQAVDHFLYLQREGQEVGVYGQQERILPSTRTQQSWEEVEISWDTASETLKLLLTLLSQLNQSLNFPKTFEDLEEVQSDLGSEYRRFFEIDTNMAAFVGKPEQSSIYWVEISSPPRKLLTLQIAPLHIGALMEKHLWHEKSSVILTSATLTTRGNFDYLRSRLSADEADELMLGSPFDYESSSLLYLANDIPEPNDRINYQKAVERTLINLSKATQGKLLALFTSYAQLKQTSQIITPVLAKSGIIVYEQDKSASASSLLENFRSADKAVLLGTRSFWEGIDVPGEALSVLAIVKLPFDVPTDPVVAARAETFEDPFNEFSLPEAILLFRQGFGRLIRTQFDRGVVAVLDKRLLTKRYGKAFLESLPVCTIRVDSMNNLPAASARWLNL